MTPFELASLKLSLECIGIDDHGFLIPTSGSTCDDIEKLLCLKFSETNYLCLWRRDEFDKHAPLIPTLSFEEIFNARIPYIPSQDIRSEYWYYFDITMTGSYTQFSNVYPIGIHDLGDTPETLDTFAVLYDGNVVSKAWSVRRNNKSAECAVETVDSFRRMGYGRMVVTAWAINILAQGKVPLYAHRPNMQSQKLAESLGAIKFAEVVSYQ